TWKYALILPSLARDSERSKGTLFAKKKKRKRNNGTKDESYCGGSKRSSEHEGVRSTVKRKTSSPAVEELKRCAMRSVVRHGA
ncbi:hypothetical protein CHS0354_023498, partial [Potamilus streckersoni]